MIEERAIEGDAAAVAIGPHDHRQRELRAAAAARNEQRVGAKPRCAADELAAEWAGLGRIVDGGERGAISRRFLRELCVVDAPQFAVRAAANEPKQETRAHHKRGSVKSAEAWRRHPLRLGAEKAHAR